VTLIVSAPAPAAIVNVSAAAATSIRLVASTVTVVVAPRATAIALTPAEPYTVTASTFAPPETVNVLLAAAARFTVSKGFTPLACAVTVVADCGVIAIASWFAVPVTRNVSPASPPELKVTFCNAVGPPNSVMLSVSSSPKPLTVRCSTFTSVTTAPKPVTTSPAAACVSAIVSAPAVPFSTAASEPAAGFPPQMSMVA